MTSMQGIVETAPSIRSRLAGRHVLLTGVTGFVGEALLHLLLAEVPEVRLSVLVRPKGSTPGAARITTLLAKPIFAAAVEAAGGVPALLEQRISVVEGDLAEPPALPRDLDAVVHCAGDVSFDPPVDDAFRTNVVGVRALLDRIEEASPSAHYLHVSTAYVSGRRRGHIFEGPVEHDVDLEAELAWGLAQRTEIEGRSRQADVLAGLRTRAEREHGRAGLLTAASAAEEERKRWVRRELVRVGTERARSLGWTDCYTFTKALGERVVEAYATAAPAGHRVTIFRPSIIESALERPHPGWIEGFKMAEPLILAFGRGELPVFPANPDTTVDIVPIDHVVSSIVAALAHPPVPAEPAYLHLVSGHRNPLSFGALLDHVRASFEREPFTHGARGPVRLPQRPFPGPAAVERMLLTGERAHRAADWVISRAPRGERTRALAQRIDTEGHRLRFLRRYLALYEEYAQADLRFVDDRMTALYATLSPADRATFAFDTSVIDWRHYLEDIHIPAVTRPVRDLDALRSRRRPTAPGRLPRVREGERIAAFFDMDGTLLSSNVIETYLWMRLGELPTGGRLGELSRVAARLPRWIQADRKERSSFLRSVYQEYAGARLADLEAIADRELTPHVLSRLSPDAVRRIREHRSAGHRTVLVTGAIRPLTRPLAPLFDHIEAADLAVDARGICTGRLSTSPMVGESRAAFVTAYAREHGLDLATSYAYADSHSDLPLLAAVGRPVAVRPDVALYRHARQAHWTIVNWSSPAAASRIPG